MSDFTQQAAVVISDAPLGSPTSQLARLLFAAQQELEDKVIAISAKAAASKLDVKMAIQQVITTAALSTSLLLGDSSPVAAAYKQATAEELQSQPLAETAQPQQLQQPEQLNSEDARLAVAVTAEEHSEILQKIAEYTQSPPGHLPHDEELYVEQQLSDILGFTVTAELDGHRLNHSIGSMGSEQHLKRHPTDTLEAHDAYQEAGIAPNRGAFGWFTEQGKLTEKAMEREKYYFAVQTMYLPDWNKNHPTLKPWYAFRKMVVINPHEKTAVVGVVGDAGPAHWVQKQFGGSPEVIREGKIWSKATRGKIMLLFVDDPDDQIPLGPIDLSFESLYKLQSNSVVEESGL